MARALAGACCLLLSLGAAAHPAKSHAADSLDAAYWAAPVEAAPGFVAGSVCDAAFDSDLAFVAQGWRWSPGTNAWISVLVRVNSLQAIAFARIGGLYGP
jgi:hypothetical protein